MVRPSLGQLRLKSRLSVGAQRVGTRSQRPPSTSVRSADFSPPPAIYELVTANGTGPASTR
jgi:hypothetical protein